MNEILGALLLLIGGAFMLLAGIGVVRMPDLFMRMQAATKAATLGAGCMLLAVAIHFDDLAVSTRALLVTAFIFLTAPVAAHVIARAAYSVGVPLWDGTLCDELRTRQAQVSRDIAVAATPTVIEEPPSETSTSSPSSDPS